MSYLDDIPVKESGQPFKSGYELRTDLLGMAQGILCDKVGRQFDNECLRPEGQRQAVAPYTTEDVIAEAEKLYAFIQKK